METKIISQEKNPFFGREEITMEIMANSTPSFDEVKKELGKDEKLTVIKKINTNFGRKKFIAEIVVYENEDMKKKVEMVPQKIRKKIEAEEKAKAEEEKKAAEEAKAAEAAAAEAPVEEEKTEETPTEEEKAEEETEAKPEEKAE